MYIRVFAKKPSHFKRSTEKGTADRLLGENFEQAGRADREIKQDDGQDKVQEQGQGVVAGDHDAFRPAGGPAVGQVFRGGKAREKNMVIPSRILIW